MKIAVCFDDTPISHKALKMAEVFAMKANAELLVVSTITRDRPIRHSRLQKMEEEMESRIAELRSARSVNCVCKLLVDSAETGEQVVKFADRKKVDWLYIGTPRKSRLAKLILGSISLFIILNAPCPVVTISERVNLA